MEIPLFATHIAYNSSAQTIRAWVERALKAEFHFSGSGKLPVSKSTREAATGTGVVHGGFGLSAGQLPPLGSKGD